LLVTGTEKCFGDRFVAQVVGPEVGHIENAIATRRCARLWR
jgi:hypothetical protein